MPAGPVRRGDDRFEFVEYSQVPGENYMGQEFRLEGANACRRRSEFGIYCQRQGAPIPACGQFEGFLFRFVRRALRGVARDR
jgi:hypothetical protein